MLVPRTLDTNGWRAHRERTGDYLHIFLNGIEVTTSCVYYNVDVGYVLLYRFNGSGVPCCDALDRPIADRIDGKVEVIPVPDRGIPEIWQKAFR